LNSKYLWIFWIFRLQMANTDPTPELVKKISTWYIQNEKDANNALKQKLIDLHNEPLLNGKIKVYKKNL
jgi:hypothetical protein